MSVGSVLIGLQASRADGRGVSSAEFIAPLTIQSGEVESTRADGGAWASGVVYFAVVRCSDFEHLDKTADAGAQCVAFEVAILKAFMAFGHFLDQRSTEVIAAMRAAGMSVRVIVDVRMDQDQMELDFPPELLVACGRHGLGIYVISNDISANEVLSVNRDELDTAPDTSPR